MVLANQKSATDPAPASGGILPCQAIERLIEDGALELAQPVIERQIQPASLDLRLGATAYRVRASFLPGPGVAVNDRLNDLALHEIDLSEGAVSAHDLVRTGVHEGSDPAARESVVE